MLTVEDIGSIVAERKLRLRADITEAGWSYWELRTLNMHRLVGHLRASREYADPMELQQDIRSAVSRHFHRSWWRGMAYGVVVDGVPLESLDRVVDLVDISDNRKGTLQWVVLTAPKAQAAVAVHTWIEGYLSPVYRSLLETLRQRRVDVSSMTRARDGLAGLMFDIADLRSAALSFNMKQHAFEPFRKREQ